MLTVYVLALVIIGSAFIICSGASPARDLFHSRFLSAKGEDIHEERSGGDEDDGDGRRPTDDGRQTMDDERPTADDVPWS